MQLRRLYNEEYEALTTEGQAINHELSVFCRAIFERCAEDGISLRDAELVMTNAVAGVAAEAILTQASKKRKERKKKEGTS